MATMTPARKVAALLFAACALAGCGRAADGASSGAGGAGGVSESGGEDGGEEGGATPSPCGAPPGDPAFAVGTGDVCFESLREGQIVPRVAGPQGGYHVWVAVACASCPIEVLVRAGVKLDGAWVTPTSERIVELHSHQVAGLLATLTDPIDPSSTLAPEGSSVVMVVDLETLEGESLEHGEVSVVLGPILPWQNKCDPDPLSCGKLGALKCCS
jgi:hypothetical protein